MMDEDARETDVSAEQARAQASPRLPGADGHQRRHEGAEPSPRQGPQAAVGISPATPERLRKRAQFLYVQKGTRSGGPTVSVQARLRTPVDASPARAGFTATKKIGGAVVRNRCKRRLREAVRLLLPLHGAPGADYVFVAREATATAPWPALLDDVRNALVRLRAALAAGPSAAGRRTGARKDRTDP